MADNAQAHQAGKARQFLTFRIDRRLYALPAEEVAEVIRIPAVACVPQGPASLLGLANLRGSILPVASLRRLLGDPVPEETQSGRAIVLDGAAPVALTVDVVDALVSVEADRLETRQAQLSAEPGERLRGAFAAAGDEGIAKILDIQPLLAAAFTTRARGPKRQRSNAIADRLHDTQANAHDEQKLITFEIADQEYAFDLDEVREIIPAPQAVAVDPRSETMVIGVSAYRDTLLPLLSLRGVLGFPPAERRDGREKVVVTAVSGVLVGLVVDRMRSIIASDPAFLEPPPAVLAARSSGEAKIKAIYRGDLGRRLISILAPDQLFREDVMQRLGGKPIAPHTQKDEAAVQRDELKFLVFRLGNDEFALPVAAVDEVAHVPHQITRLPKTPAFLEGVINLRGEVLPVVDQRRRFNMPELAATGSRRLIVVHSHRHRAGLIVDSVSEVLRCFDDVIEPAPDLTGETTQVVIGVINLERSGRIVMLLDPAELLSQAERGLLDAFQVESKVEGKQDLS